MQFNPRISTFINARTNTPDVPAGVAVSDILESIKNGAFKASVEAVRNATDKKQRDERKKTLRAVTWSGHFTKRNVNPKHLENYSFLICHDIDKLDPERLIEVKDYLSADIMVFAVFVSPSGNGLKVIFRTNVPVGQFLQVWTATGQYIEDRFKGWKIKVDQACKDISRLCFVSYDPELVYHPDAVIFSADHVTEWTPVAPEVKAKIPMQPGKQDAVTTDHGEAPDYIAKCHEIVTKSVQPVDGSFNTYINQFAIQANRYGIEQYQAADAIAHFCGWSAPDKEDLAVISSVYKTFAAEHRKYLTGNSPKAAHTQAAKPKESTGSTPPQSGKYNTTVKFWYKVKKIDKDGNTIIDEDSEFGEYKYSYDDAITFLENNGFYKFRVGAGYQFVQVDKVNKQVEIVDELRIKEFMIDFLKSNPSNEYKRVREMFRRGAKNYCSTGILEGLEYCDPKLTRDTANNAYVYFKNCFLDITKDGIAIKQYSTQQGHIWKRQMLDADFKQADFKNSDVNRFVLYATIGRKAPIEDYTPEELQKYEALCTTIGYMLHRYKSPALTKAIITTDKKLRSTGENNGRSGKSLLVKLIGKMLNVVTIDGRNFSFDKDFNFQKVNVDTALINFDDVKPNFDFSRLFSMITEEFSFEKKRIDLITIPFSDAPKFLISSNSTLKGGGESATARQQIIEFSSFFNSSHQPATEFGRMFFTDWDKEEWERYYSFMVHCVMLYLQRGIIPFPLENYGLNKLIDTAGDEFVDYMDDTVLTDLHKKNEFDSKLLHETYLTKVNAKYPVKKNSFSKWVKMWADLHELLINAHKAEGRDRRNGVDYLIFTKAIPDNLPESDETLPF